MCQHCRSYQSFFGGERDPRGWLIVLGFIVVGIGGSAVMGLIREPAELAVSEVSSRVVAGPEGPRMFVLGRVTNAGASAGTRVWFRVDVYDDGDRVVDTFLAESPGLVVPANGEARFRIVAATSVSEAARVDVTVDRSR